ncbi:MAG TPA: hypothetical protein P5175_01210 [Anaerohalosphaeraceae bacterium]|nr:hypothetical protein [Anaerohalosphaeraceae bacterium]
MFQMIDKLQKVVNSLLGLCEEGGAGVSEEDIVSPEYHKYEPLGIMILKMQDGVLEKRYFLRMEKWLLCDPAAVEYYIDFQMLTALLHEHFNKSRLEKIADSFREIITGKAAANS